MRLFFDTKSEWIEALRRWAAGEPRISSVWIFGSRATGNRATKPAASIIPDLDVGYLLDGDSRETLGYAMFMEDRWRAELTAAIPVAIDLQLADRDDDLVVWPAISDHGVLVYERSKSAS